jgi:cell division protease FtsH
VHQVSVIKRGMAGGFTMPLPTEDREYHTKTYMYESIVTFMGGRVAEQLTLDDISTGASNDLQRATELARRMVTRYGFSEAVGPIVYGSPQSEVFLGRDYSAGRTYSEEIAAEIDREVRAVIESAYKRTTEILTENMSQLRQVADYLLEHEKIDGEDFVKLMEGTLEIPEKKIVEAADEAAEENDDDQKQNETQ